MDEVSHENWFMILHNSGEIINEYNNSMIFNNSYKTLLLNEPFLSMHCVFKPRLCLWWRVYMNEIFKELFVSAKSLKIVFIYPTMRDLYVQPLHITPMPDSGCTMRLIMTLTTCLRTLCWQRNVTTNEIG